MTGTEDSGHKPPVAVKGCSGRIAPQQKSSTGERKSPGTLSRICVITRSASAQRELDGAGHLFIGTHAENMAEREYRGRGNLHNPLWRHQGRAARAAAARLLRAHTLTHGYEQQKIDELIRGIIMPGQQPLF